MRCAVEVSMSSPSAWTLSLCTSISLLLGVSALLTPDPRQEVKTATKAPSKAADGPAKAALRIDLSTAMNVNLPAASRDLEAVSFGTPDGKTGWVLRLPGWRPIATPAYADGMLFVGGGYGSHEFYAVDSETGKIIWKIQTGDDGPTAAVVADGMVAFNTESCTLVVVDERRGRVIWQEWLGDPLMSQPAIDKGVLFMAHPAATGRPQKPVEFHPRPASPGGSHRLLAAELSTGRHIWEQKISGDVITAPVISDGTVYFTTFNGTSYALNAADGSVVGVKVNAATSAPVIANGQLYETRKTQAGKDTVEGHARGGEQGTDPECSGELHQLRACVGRAPVVARGGRRSSFRAGWPGFFAAGGGPRLSLSRGRRRPSGLRTAERWRRGFFVCDEGPDRVPAGIGKRKRLCGDFRWAADLPEDREQGC